MLVSHGARLLPQGLTTLRLSCPKGGGEGAGQLWGEASPSTLRLSCPKGRHRGRWSAMERGRTFHPATLLSKAGVEGVGQPWNEATPFTVRLPLHRGASRELVSPWARLHPPPCASPVQREESRGLRSPWARVHPSPCAPPFRCIEAAGQWGEGRRRSARREGPCGACARAGVPREALRPCCSVGAASGNPSPCAPPCPKGGTEGVAQP